MTLLQKLLTADVICKDCGTKYGKYSVGCSSTWNGICGVCGENKPVTEVRDWGYLTKGIHAEKAKIREQSLEVANYMKCQEEIASQETDNHPITPPPDLVEQWDAEAPLQPLPDQIYVANQAARWGADKELEACCEWFASEGYGTAPDRLRAVRRPHPPSLKERIATAIAHGDNSIALALLNEALPD